MEKKSMRKNNRTSMLVICLMALFAFSACAQEHRKNESRLAQINNAINNTVLLNNQKNLVPILSLDTNTIASVSLGYAQPVDSRQPVE